LNSFSFYEEYLKHKQKKELHDELEGVWWSCPDGIRFKQDVKEILLYAIDSLKITITETGYTCEVDKNKNLPNTPFNIDTVVNLITYGSIEIKGYGIIIKAFEFVVNKLSTLKKIYASKNKKIGE
jgi:hypothetical protein